MHAYERQTDTKIRIGGGYHVPSNAVLWVEASGGVEVQVAFLGLLQHVGEEQEGRAGRKQRHEHPRVAVRHVGVVLGQRLQVFQGAPFRLEVFRHDLLEKRGVGRKRPVSLHGIFCSIGESSQVKMNAR